MYAQTCCYLMMSFNLMKNFVSYISWAQNSEINHFKPIFKRDKFYGVIILPLLRWILSPRFGRRRLGDRDTSSLDSSLLPREVPSSW